VRVKRSAVSTAAGYQCWDGTRGPVPPGRWPAQTDRIPARDTPGATPRALYGPFAALLTCLFHGSAVQVQAVPGPRLSRIRASRARPAADPLRPAGRTRPPRRAPGAAAAEHRSLRDRHGAQLAGPVVDVAEDVAVERLQVGKVVPAGQPPFQVDQPRRGQRRLGPGQFGGMGDARQIAQHAAGRIQIQITGRAAHPR
jgi:hypothetical protein